MANSKQKIIVHPKDKNEPLEKEATSSASIEKNKEIVDENSNSNIFYSHSVMKISDKFSGRFSMNNLGTLVCENPVTKQDIQELKDYINENRSVLETAGLWRDPSVISFTTGKNDSSTPSIQVLDTELAAALASWKITQIESRSNYLQLVPNENMNSPLNIFSDLEHLRMYNGFQFAGNPETQIDMLKKSKPLYISMGTSKGNVCEMQDEILAGAEVLSVFISGGEKARIGKNSLAQNRIDDTSKLALEQSMNNVSKKPDYFLHRDIVVDNFKELVKGIDKNNNELLEKLSSSEKDISSFIRDQLVKSIFMEEETSLKDFNSLSDEELIDLIKAKLKTPLINRNVLESLKANEQLKKELKIGKDNAHKTLHLPIGTELGTCATQGTGIKAIEQRRMSHYTAEFDKTKIFYSSLQDSITQSFVDLRQELISVGIRVPDNSFKHDDFKKAFEEFLNDNSLSPDAKTRIDSLRSICLQLCSEYLKASKWLSENPDKYLYMFNQSLRGTTLNQKLERLEKVLSDPDKTFTAEEKLSCENTLKELKEEKTKLLEELKVNGKMDTLCNNIVSEEVENVDLDYKQTKDQATTFPYAFNVNQSDGSCHIVDPSEGASKSEVLRGRVAEGMETLQTFGQKVLQYKHVSWGESIIYSGVVLSSIATTWAKKGVSCIHKKKIESDVKLATAYRIVAPLINSEEESSKDEIVFDKEGSWGQVLKFKSEEAERAWAAKGISLKLKNGHSIINVDLALATGGKEHGTVDIFGDTFRYIRKRNALPRVCAKEEKNREILDAIDLARKDRISRLVEKAQKRKDKTTRSY